MNSAPDHFDLPADLVHQLQAAMRCPPSQWSAAVETILREHPEHAESMLAWLERDGVSSPNTADPGTRPGQGTDRPSHVGPYRILESLGEGGMGEVFLARREDLGVPVALKVVKPGMDTRAFLARFTAERLALSRMEHNNIARVLDAGASEDGRPYFVMELVRGVPITRYSDDHRLSIEQRLTLFQQVCAGVQHAHSKGVMHRDLTPNNVLVTVQDGQATAKIIDFGLARATDRSGLQQTVYTERGTFLGTPEYMSPEQAGLDGLDIDTRTDVYSLGVLLYELLTGELPFRREELRAAGYEGICRTIREKEPARPSSRVTTLGPSTTRVATLRRTEPRQLLQCLRGDLDWIVLKCLEKDRTRRYETPTHLADDVRRHLEDEPVTARPPSAAYRLRKVARKYRRELLAVGVAALSLGVGGGVALWSLVTASSARASEQVSKDEAVSARVYATAARSDRDLIAATADVERLLRERSAQPWLVPGRVPDAERYLAEADAVLALAPALQKRFEELLARAEPWDDAQRAADRAGHPAYAEWEEARSELAYREHVVHVGGDRTRLELPALSQDDVGRPAAELRMLGWPLVDPEVDLRIFGEEARGLALAQLAMRKLVPQDRLWLRVQVSDFLAWAWFANGMDDEAVAQAERSVALVAANPTELAWSAAIRSRLEDLRGQIRARTGASGALSLEQLRGRVSALEARLGERRTFAFADDSDRRLFLALQAAVTRVRALASEGGVEPLRRACRWVRAAQAATSLHPRSTVTWDEVAVTMAAADGTHAHAAYRGLPSIRPQFGLVPIGFNPATKLLELYDLRSAWDGMSARDPAELEIPRHATDGAIAMGDDMGMVFVLLPGGECWTGAQNDDPEARLYDPEGGLYPRCVRLDPFLISRFEMTQGQYLRLTGKDPSDSKHGSTLGAAITWANPVEQVSYDDAERDLARYGLALPSDVQWEYACRAGTSSPFSCPVDALATHANLNDQAWGRLANRPPAEPWDDGHAMHATVGSFAPNPFGLYDMHGNVFEWTADGPGQGMPRAGDGLRPESVRATHRNYRGGAYTVGRKESRSVWRGRVPRRSSNHDIGIRPIRRIEW
ncbi:MAG: bifunctional serine/threonine-protein kinase/formylglycine-generating enzyme family protein [Planctomycetota bacterium]